MSDRKAIPFKLLLFDPSLVTVRSEDFASILKQEGFHFDESAEALLLMSEDDKAAVKRFDQANT